MWCRQHILLVFFFSLPLLCYFFCQQRTYCFNRMAAALSEPHQPQHNLKVSMPKVRNVENAVYWIRKIHHVFINIFARPIGQMAIQYNLPPPPTPSPEPLHHRLPGHLLFLKSQEVIAGELNTNWPRQTSKWQFGIDRLQKHRLFFLKKKRSLLWFSYAVSWYRRRRKDIKQCTKTVPNKTFTFNENKV